MNLVYITNTLYNNAYYAKNNKYFKYSVLVTTYDFLRHLQATHKNASLRQPAFWMEFDEWFKEKTYFYCNNDIFVTSGYKYTASTNKLVLYLQLYGSGPSRRNVRHKFKLYSFGNEVPYETGLYELVPFLFHVKSLFFRGHC